MGFCKILMTAALLLCAVPAIAGAEEAVSAAEAAMCEGLKPFKDMDELVYQIYTNLDSDCLFKMDPKELAEIWRIPSIKYIDTHYRPARVSEELRPSAEGDHGHLLLRVVESDDDSSIDLYTIEPSDYKNAEIFYPTTDFPKGLPDPLVYGLGHPTSPVRAKECTKGRYIGSNMYIWFNKDKTRMLSLKTGCGIVVSIDVQDVVYPHYIFNSHKY